MFWNVDFLQFQSHTPSTPTTPPASPTTLKASPELDGTFLNTVPYFALFDREQNICPGIPSPIFVMHLRNVSPLWSNLGTRVNAPLENTVWQVCIPVGCLPPACCPYLPACTAPREGLLPGVGDVCSGGGGVCSRGEGGCLLPGRGCIPACTEADTPLWTEWLTDRCKNITFPNFICGR